MSRLLLGVIIWVSGFLLLEVPAHFLKDCPYPTLSRTIWDGVKWWHPVAYFVGVFVVVLLGHFEFEWPATWLTAIASALTLAILIHIAVR